MINTSYIYIFLYPTSFLYPTNRCIKCNYSFLCVCVFVRVSLCVHPCICVYLSTHTTLMHVCALVKFVCVLDYDSVFCLVYNCQVNHAFSADVGVWEVTSVRGDRYLSHWSPLTLLPAVVWEVTKCKQWRPSVRGNIPVLLI